MNNLPKTVNLKWHKIGIPEKYGVFAVQCVEKTIKNGKSIRTNKKWFSFAEFVSDKQSGSGGRWTVLGAGLHTTSYVNATDNIFDVISWAEINRDSFEEKTCS